MTIETQVAIQSDGRTSVRFLVRQNGIEMEPQTQAVLMVERPTAHMIPVIDRSRPLYLGRSVVHITKTSSIT